MGSQGKDPQGARTPARGGSFYLDRTSVPAWGSLRQQRKLDQGEADGFGGSNEVKDGLQGTWRSRRSLMLVRPNSDAAVWSLT